MQNLDEVVDDKRDQHYLQMSSIILSNQNNDVNTHNLLGVLNTQHSPNDQNNYINDCHIGIERKTTVHGSRQMSIWVLCRHFTIKNDLIQN